MNELRDQTEPTILVGRHARMMSIVLNRPRVLNSLNLEMIRFIDPEQSQSGNDSLH
jgi:enoyl-CoA hydratase/carnithine racemase